jgi:hypothetical protein
MLHMPLAHAVVAHKFLILSAEVAELLVIMNGAEQAGASNVELGIA